MPHQLAEIIKADIVHQALSATGSVLLSSDVFTDANALFQTNKVPVGVKLKFTAPVDLGGNSVSEITIAEILTETTVRMVATADATVGAIGYTVESAQGDFRLASEPCGTIFNVDPADLQFPRLRTEEITPTPGFGPGAGVVVTVPDSTKFQVGEFVEVVDPTVPGKLELTSVTAIDAGGPNTITLRALVNTYNNVATRIYKLFVYYSYLIAVDPNPACTEVTTISLYGTWRDAQVIRAKWTDLSNDEFDFMFTDITDDAAPVTPRDEAIADLICTRMPRFPLIPAFADFWANLGIPLNICDEQGVTGEGTYNPGTNIEDGGPFVSHSCATFEDQFEDFSGTATFDEYIFEIPFDTFLTRASIHTNASTAADAYVTITKNDVVPIVAAGPVPPNRNLPAVTGVVKGLDLPNIACLKGDKITVRLNLVLANTIKRAKIVLAHAPRLKNL
jgi:hypothetical protein